MKNVNRKGDQQQRKKKYASPGGVGQEELYDVVFNDVLQKVDAVKDMFKFNYFTESADNR